MYKTIGNKSLITRIYPFKGPLLGGEILFSCTLGCLELGALYFRRVRGRGRGRGGGGRRRRRRRRRRLATPPTSLDR